MAKYRVKFTEVTTYEVDIESEIHPDEDPDWFSKVDTQYPAYVNLNCDSVDNRELVDCVRIE